MTSHSPMAEAADLKSVQSEFESQCEDRDLSSYCDPCVTCGDPLPLFSSARTCARCKPVLSAIIERQKGAKVERIRLRLENRPVFDLSLDWVNEEGRRIFHEIICAPILDPCEILMRKEEWEMEQPYYNWSHSNKELLTEERSQQLKLALAGFRMGAAHQRQREEAHA